MEYGEKWERETEGQAAEAVTGVFPSLWGFPCACGSRDQLLGHGGLSWCCMKVRQEGPCKEPELAFPGAWRMDAPFLQPPQISSL